MTVQARTEPASINYIVDTLNIGDIFNINFKYLNDDETLTVFIRNNANDRIDLTLDVDYEVASSDGTNGVWGTIKILKENKDVSNICIYRDIEVSQERTFTSQTIFSTTTEDALDKLTMILQDDLESVKNRSLHVAVDDVVNPGDLELPLSKDATGFVYRDENGKFNIGQVGEAAYALRQSYGEIEDPTFAMNKYARANNLLGFDAEGSVKYTKPYTAGDHITISPDNIISSTDTVYTAGDNIQIDSENVISATDTTYTAGDNITISPDNVISTSEGFFPYTIKNIKTISSVFGDSFNYKFWLSRAVSETGGGKIEGVQFSGASTSFFATVIDTNHIDNIEWHEGGYQAQLYPIESKVEAWCIDTKQSQVIAVTFDKVYAFSVRAGRFDNSLITFDFPPDELPENIVGCASDNGQVAIICADGTIWFGYINRAYGTPVGSFSYKKKISATFDTSVSLHLVQDTLYVFDNSGHWTTTFDTSSPITHVVLADVPLSRAYFFRDSLVESNKTLFVLDSYNGKVKLTSYKQALVEEKLLKTTMEGVAFDSFFVNDKDEIIASSPQGLFYALDVFVRRIIEPQNYSPLLYIDNNIWMSLLDNKETYCKIISVLETIKENSIPYTAGDNVRIDSEKVISATDTRYTAGDHITISPENVISASYTRADNLVTTAYLDFIPFSQYVAQSSYISIDTFFDSINLVRNNGQYLNGSQSRRFKDFAGVGNQAKDVDFSKGLKATEQSSPYVFFVPISENTSIKYFYFFDASTSVFCTGSEEVLFFTTTWTASYSECRYITVSPTGSNRANIWASTYNPNYKRKVVTSDVLDVDRSEIKGIEPISDSCYAVFCAHKIYVFQVSNQTGTDNLVYTLDIEYPYCWSKCFVAKGRDIYYLKYNTYSRATVTVPNEDPASSWISDLEILKISKVSIKQDTTPPIFFVVRNKKNNNKYLAASWTDLYTLNVNHRYVLYVDPQVRANFSNISFSQFRIGTEPNLSQSNPELDQIVCAWCPLDAHNHNFGVNIETIAPLYKVMKANAIFNMNRK